MNIIKDERLKDKRQEDNRQEDNRLRDKRKQSYSLISSNLIIFLNTNN